MKHLILCQTLVMLYHAGVITAGDDYGNKLTKVWSVTGAVNGGSTVVNVTSASIVIPSAYSDHASSRTSKDIKISAPDFKQYVFKPRAIPLRRSDQAQDSNVYYTQDPNGRYKSEILFPGNYFTIAKEKSNENLTKESAYNPLNAEPFKPKTIPLMREDFQKRSLDDEEEPSAEEAEQFSEQTASRRSISYIFGADEDEENEDEDGDYEADDDAVEQKEGSLKSKIKHKLKRAKKFSKYMMPLLLAYKLKYFALVPVMISGLILLLGATGMAGFFFALFAAVMGLQKGGY